MLLVSCCVHSRVDIFDAESMHEHILRLLSECKQDFSHVHAHSAVSIKKHTPFFGFLDPQLYVLPVL